MTSPVERPVRIPFARRLGRFREHGVAGRQGGGNLPGEYGEREIPWADAGDDAAAVRADDFAEEALVNGAEDFDGDVGEEVG